MNKGVPSIKSIIDRVGVKPLARHRVLTSVTLLILFVFLGSSVSVLADVRIDSRGFRNLNLGSWAGQGPVEFTQTFCVESVLGRRNRSTTVLPYSLQITNRNASAGFSLDRSGSLLPFSLTFVDLRNRTEEAMRAGIATSQNKTGAALRCAQGGNNAAVKIRFDTAALQQAESGRYRARFRVLARGGSNGTEQHTLNNINVTFTIDPVISVNGLDDMVLTLSGAGSAIDATETFCVYRNSGTQFNFSIESNERSGMFSLNSSTDAAPYSLVWTDDAGSIDVASGVIYTNRRADFDGGPDCSAADNASLRLTIESSVTDTLSSGQYRDTIVLRVAPE